MTKSALLMKMVEVLRSRPGITVSELGEIVKRSERTVYRWLGELDENLNMGICCRDGGYYVGEDSGSRIDFKSQELLAMRLSLRSGPSGTGSLLKKQADSAWLKIRNDSSIDAVETVTESVARHPTEMKQDVHLNSELFEALEDAMNKCDRLHVVYRDQDSNCVKHYTIDPYALVFRKHSWYLVAKSEAHGKVLQLKLARLLRTERTGARFDPPGLSIQDYFNWSWEVWGGDESVTCRIKFSPIVVRGIAETKHDTTQANHPQPDGSLIMEVCVSSINEIGDWVMGHGRDAQVLEPAELRQFVRDLVKGMTAIYEGIEMRSKEISAAARS